MCIPDSVPRAIRPYADMPDHTTSHTRVSCPYCGEIVSITFDPAGGARQEYVEDCQVCCRPWQMVVSVAPDGTAEVTVTAADDL